MTTTSLPKEFKFKALEDCKANMRFILFLVSQGFETVGEKDEFISKYVLSGIVYSYVIEDNTIKILLKDTNEEDFENDDTTEICISDFNIGTVLSDEESSLADNKLLINKTIKTLSQINPAALTAAEVSEIEMFGLTVNRMHTVS